MKKIIASLLMIFGLLIGGNVNAYAGTWIQHQGNDAIIDGIYQGGWEYQNDDGTMASGWKYINENWYYFYPEDGVMAKNVWCDWNNEIGSYDGCSTGIEINDQIYYFDKNGHMLHDCYIIQGSACVQYWINSDGTSDYVPWGDKYTGFDKSQVK